MRVHIRNQIESCIRRERKQLPSGTLAEDRRERILYFIGRVRTAKPVDGMVSPEFNLDVMQIVEAARRSAENGRPLNLPLK